MGRDSYNASIVLSNYLKWRIIRIRYCNISSVYFTDWTMSCTQTGPVFYGCDLFKNGTIFYRPVVDRLDMYFFLWTGQSFQTWLLGLDCCSWLYLVLSYFTGGQPGLSYILRMGQHFGPVVVTEDACSYNDTN